MNENEKISQTLDGLKPTLATEQKDLLWENISTKIAKPAPTLSPYLFIFKNKKHMAPIALALVLMLSMSGVVAASETARPGDTLFLIDQTVEDIRLALASDESKTNLEAEFAIERLAELSSILSESVRKDNSPSTATSTGTTTQFSAEADVFFDTTIVEVEINDKKTTFATTAKTKEAVIDEVVNRFGIARATVEAALDFEIEDRASEDRDRADLTISPKDETRVNEAVSVALSYLLKSGLNEQTRDTLFTQLATMLDGVPVQVKKDRIRLDDDNTKVEIREDGDDSRIEIRDGENRIRIREKDGEIRIETKNDFDSYQTQSNSSTSSVIRTFEAEADVYPDTTFVEVEINDKKTIFETTADTREEVVSEIVSRFGVARATVEAALDFEIEDSSEKVKADSATDNDDDEYEDDDSGRDEDEDDDSEDREDSEDDEDEDEDDHSGKDRDEDEEDEDEDSDDDN